MVKLARRRLAGDGGVSMMEMLMAMVIIAIALFALLGSLVTSAASVAEQQARSGGTRAVTTHLETVREMGFDELKLEIDAGGMAPTTITVDDRVFDVVTDLQEVDAADPASAPVAGQPTIITVESTVSWSVRGATKSITSTTAVAPDEAEIAEAQAITSVNFDPNPTIVDSAGAPLEAIEIKVVLEGFDDTAVVKVSWTDDEAVGTKTAVLTSGDSGVTWTGQLTNVEKNVAEGQTDVTEDFTIFIETTSLSRIHTQGFRRENTGSVAFTSTTISQNPITVTGPSPNCNGAKKCTNTQAVTFTAEVTGLDPVAGDTVSLKFELRDGTTTEVKLDHVSGDIWGYTAQAESTKFKPGNPANFFFTALLANNDPPVTTTLEHWVSEIST